MRDRALRGSPWLPVVTSTTCSGGYWFSSSTLDESALRDVHIAQLLGHGRVVDHAAAAEGHLAAILHSQINDLLHAVDVGGKGRNDDALVPGAGKQAAHTGSHLLLRWR